MKELLSLTGGYRRVMNYVLNLQAETLTLGNSILSSLGFDMVLAGCAVTDNHNGTINIAPGIIYVNGEALRFDGANNVVSTGAKSFVKGAYVTTDSKTFGDGSIKNVYREAKAVIANVDPDNLTQIKIKTTLYNLQQYIRDTVNGYEPKGAYKDIYDFDGTFLENFDASGLGVTPRWIGWARDNGNNGTPGSIGRALIAAGTYTQPGTGVETVFAHGTKSGEVEHKLTGDESGKPFTPPTLDGPRHKPADGGGGDIYYPTSTFGVGADATNGHNNMPPVLPVYRVIKIVD